VTKLPPTHEPPDDFDDWYRRVSAQDPSRPSETVRQAVLTHAASLVRSPRSARSSHRRALLGTLAAAALAGLLVTPHWFEPPPRAPASGNSAVRIPAPAAQAPPVPRPKLSELSSAPSPQALASESAMARKSRTAADAAVAGTGVQQASATGDLARLQALLDQRVDIEERDSDGRTPLMLAAEHGQFEVVKALLAHGANPNAPDARGLTPLQAAVAGNHSAIAAALRKAGALQ
jgi:hypothetical protein